MATSEVRPCPACQAKSGRRAGEVRGFALQRCGGCGTIFTAQLPSEREAHDYDSRHSRDGQQVPQFVSKRLEETVAALAPYRALGRWLDVGCGAGTLMRAAKAGGWEVVGTEVSSGAVDAGRNAGLDMRLGELAELALPDAGFDVVSMVEVLEHVADPDPLLAHVARLVRPGGAVYLTTPHGQGLSARLLRTRWSVVAPPEHLQLFSVEGVHRALGRAGLVVRSVRTHAVNPHELVAAVRRRNGQGERFEARKETSYRLNESLSASPRGAFVKALVNGALSATRLGDSLKVVAGRPATSPPDAGRPRA